jgi:hypothetical protein
VLEIQNGLVGDERATGVPDAFGQFRECEEEVQVS